MKSLILLFVSLFSISAFSQSVGAQCPLGKDETTLTLTRVMRNFGTSLNAADMAVLTNNMTDAQIQKAVSGIEVAIVCAQVVIDANVDGFMPSHMSNATAEQRAEYVKIFLKFLGDFEAMLVEYKQGFLKQAAVPEDSRVVSELDIVRRKIKEQASASHDEL